MDLRIRIWLNIAQRLMLLTTDLLEQKIICLVQGVKWRIREFSFDFLTLKWQMIVAKSTSY